MPRHLFIIVFLSILIAPCAVFAAEASTTPPIAPAGFATTPIWISKANPVEGDVLKIFAVVSNGTATTMSDSVSFIVNGTVVGSVKASLDAGTSQIVSTPWTAVVGTHTITGTFLGTTAGPLSITIAPAPPKPAVLQYLDTAVGAATPLLSGALQAIEDLRKSGADYFDNQLNTPISDVREPGTILGTSTEKLASTINPSLFNRFGAFIFQNPMIFYPVFILLFFFLWWIVLKIFSRN